MPLSTYVLETQQLVRDTNTQFYSLAQVQRAVNGARTQIAKMCGCITGLVYGSAPYGNQATVGQAVVGGAVVGAQGSLSNQTSVFNTIAGQEMYTFQGFANPLARQLYSGVKGIVSVNDVAVSWGGVKPALDFIPWNDLQAYARSYPTGTTSWPFVWSSQNNGENDQVWLFPLPSSATEMEWHCNFVPKPLYYDTDPEALPSPFTDGVKYWAARLLYLQSSRFGDARVMTEEFKNHIGIDRLSTDYGKVEEYYFGDQI